MRKIILSGAIALFSSLTIAKAPLVSIDTHDQFFDNIAKHCGKAFEGKVTVDNAPSGGFDDKLVMHVRVCNEKELQVPFHVGDDASRTWIITKTGSGLSLKHDHRHKDGSEDKITQYGGSNPNTGLANIQFFPADQQTARLISYASNNVWWVTLDKTSFTYNLRRIGTDRLFSVQFDLTKEIDTPSAPWGSEDK